MCGKNNTGYQIPSHSNTHRLKTPVRLEVPKSSGMTRLCD